MLPNYSTGPRFVTAGLSVACFALMTGMSLAQDGALTDPPEPIETEVIIDVDPGDEDGTCDTCDGTGEIDPVDPTDPVEWIEDQPINIDGIGDGEPLPEVIIDDEMGGVIGEEPEVTTQEFPDSTCGGCEFQSLAGGPEVQRELSGSSHNSDSRDSIDAGPAVVSDANNICYNADLYIPLLCDWQRPFVGDRMP